MRRGTKSDIDRYNWRKIPRFPLRTPESHGHCTSFRSVAEADEPWFLPDPFVRHRRRRMRWAGLVARVGRTEILRGFWLRNMSKRDHLEDLGLDGRIVLYCGRVPVANAPGCTAVEGLLYKSWSLVIPTCTARCLHRRP